MSTKLTVEDFRPCKTCGHQKRKHHAKGTDPSQCWHKGCGGCTEFTPADEPWIDITITGDDYEHSSIDWGRVVPEMVYTERNGCSETEVYRIRPSDIYFADWKRKRRNQ